MKNFIFSVDDIFNTCLSECNVEGYYIGPYQRGYKWGAEYEHDPIPVLLADLYKAFIKSQSTSNSKEYYLQYITVKNAVINESTYFEVIDGQQRLTTLTILYSVLENKFGYCNIAKKENDYLVSYARYENPSDNIFDSTAKLPENLTDQDFEEQDRWYMYNAYHCIAKFFILLQEQQDSPLRPFIEYISENVKIILNLEDEFTAAEEVFASLNANKVPLTNSYLIKGLLLTKASRFGIDSSGKKHFREVMDERAIMGRTWDEMNTWFSQKEVSVFFFGEETGGMEKMLSIVDFGQKEKRYAEVIESFKKNLKDTKDRINNENYSLFNDFNENILDAADSYKCLEEIKHIYKKLYSLYTDNALHNFLGFHLHTIPKKDSKDLINELRMLINKKQDELLRYLKNHLKSCLPDVLDLSHYGYDKNKNSVIKLLLAFSVFPKSEDKNKERKSSYRFDFYKYLKEKWTIEHIFPQTQDNAKLEITDDKSWVIQRLESIIGDFGKKEVSEANSKRIETLRNQIEEVRSSDKVETSKISEIFDFVEDVDRIGNLALLSGGVNSSLKNGFFNTKRKILLRRINSGSFVPKHTIDVFSKMLALPEDGYDEKFEDTLTVWSDADIAAHELWIKNRIEELKNL